MNLVYIQCTRNPVSLCGPRSCAAEKGPVECRKKVRTFVQKVPEESCVLQPRLVCNTVTKLVPRLEPKEECLQVPREVRIILVIEDARNKILLFLGVHQDQEQPQEGEEAGGQAVVLFTKLAKQVI